MSRHLCGSSDLQSTRLRYTTAIFPPILKQKLEVLVLRTSYITSTDHIIHASTNDYIMQVIIYNIIHTLN